MRLLLILLLTLQINSLKADEIFNLLKIPNLDVYKLNNLNGLKYQLGDIRVELTPYTVFNADLAGTGYESSIFTERREILE